MNENQSIAQALCRNPVILAVQIYSLADIDPRGQTYGYASNVLDVRDTLGATLHIFRMYGFNEPVRICALAGDEAQSICCFRDGDKIAIVMAQTGHKILKSLRRMTQRALRRAPAEAPQPQQPSSEIGAV